MPDPIIPAAGQAFNAARAAATPYVMVRHGRTEDRAAAYDRFIRACSVAFHDGRLGHEDITELLSAVLAIDLRAPRHVRAAANQLFGRLVGAMVFPSSLGGPTTGWNTTVDIPEGQEGVSLFDLRLKGLVQYGPGELPIITSNAELLEQLREFAETARLDVTSRWWHRLLTPWGRRWWLARK
ncbi:hypothetical protein OOK27_47975 [Streptomyces canus]|uniref:hypothetical protein n=1 Tax=Streptomyces canus TaxID=58343 RepID=UPI00225465AD|nr:hypothetical protein [Streptomyces canus]MCX5261782.1 hypothetical protein [Streptomyces canus]